MTRPATPLTPSELRAQSFERSWRGYDADQVESFLARVRATMQRLQDERVQLVDQAASLEQENNSLRIKLGHLDVAAQAQIVSDQTVNMMRTAQRQIEQSLTEAEQQCRQMAADARAHYQHVVGQARLQAQTMLDEAHRRATEAGAAAAGNYRRQAGNYQASDEEFERQAAYQKAFSGFWRRQFESMLAEMSRTLDEFWPGEDRPPLEAPAAAGGPPAAGPPPSDQLPAAQPPALQRSAPVSGAAVSTP
jgi:DivIVA domain-containing protein